MIFLDRFMILVELELIIIWRN